jgi:outer membrane protein, heavy metal efflux system
MSFRYFLFVFLSGLSLLASEPAVPITADPFTLPQAVAIALRENPTLRAQGFASRIADARLQQAGTRPNPELSASAEQFLGTGSLSGVKSLETTLQLSQVLDLGGTRNRRIEVAQEERALADLDSEAKRIEVLAEVARRFTEAVADAHRLEAAREARALGEQAVTAVKARVEAAIASPIELNKARMVLAELHIEEEHAEHELAACRQSLAAVLGQSTPNFGDATGDLMALPNLPDFETMAGRLEASPALARYAVEERWHEAQARLAQSLRHSGLRVSGGLRRVEASDDFGFVAGISLPLGLRDQHAGTQREARERRAQLAPALEAARLELRATLFDVYQEMVHARTALTQLQKEVIPLAEETLALANKGYREGRFTLLELLDAQKSLVTLRHDAVANASAYHLHVVTLERLLGAPLQANPINR